MTVDTDNLYATCDKVQVMANDFYIIKWFQRNLQKASENVKPKVDQLIVKILDLKWYGKMHKDRLPGPLLFTLLVVSSTKTAVENLQSCFLHIKSPDYSA